MTDQDRTALADLTARIRALERVMVEFAGTRHTPEHVQIWHDATIRTHEQELEGVPPDDVARLVTALDRLFAFILARSRQVEALRRRTDRKSPD